MAQGTSDEEGVLHSRLPLQAPGSIQIDLRACAYAAAVFVDDQRAPMVHECTRGQDNPAAVLDEVARLFIEGMLEVVICFRPALLEISARALAFDICGALNTLSQLLGAFEELYPLVHSAIQTNLKTDQQLLQRLELIARYRLLSAAPSLSFHGSYTDLYTCFTQPAKYDAGTRFLALELYVLHKRLSPEFRAKLIARWIGDEPAPIAFAPDVRSLPIYEAKRIAALWDACASPITGSIECQPLYLRQEDLQGPLVLMSGVLIPASNPAVDVTFVETPSLAPKLATAALHIGLRLPLLITGPAASGKTHLVSYLAHRVHGSRKQPPLLTIQLGDQSGVDGKQLLGSFVSSSSTPGTFEWVEGALARAVRDGVWVLLEDIEKASGDVLSVLSPLLDALGPTKRIGTRPVLDLGARGKIEASPDFALFATRSKKQPFLTSEHWGEVNLELPTPNDLDAILAHRFPGLSRLPKGELDCIVSGWAAVADKIQAPEAPTGLRQITLRDLIKWCSRIETQSPTSIFANPLVQESVFMDACDLFFAALNDDTSLNDSLVAFIHSLLMTLADTLHVSWERAQWICNQRAPELVLSSSASTSSCRLGRVPLPRSAAKAQPSARYALTKPTLGLLERVTECVRQTEPILLVGETGTGKTSMVQYLASLYATPLTVINMSQQTESADLLGTYKPLDPKTHSHSLHNRWMTLFTRTFSERRNAPFLEAERKALVQGKWGRLAKLWQESTRMAEQSRALLNSSKESSQDGDARKKRKVVDSSVDWESFRADVDSFAAIHTGKQRHFVFTFVEGPLVNALQNGHWILLDEINLAAPETLECLSMLLQSKDSSVVLTERGDLEPVRRHSNFRLFACMNPATDVGKRDLPPGFRARFTELYVASPDSDREALIGIVAQYIGEVSVGDRSAVLDVAEWYTAVRKLANAHEIADGTNSRPHYSMRTLTRALSLAAALVPQYGLRRGLVEGVAMSFGMLLDAKSSEKLAKVTEKFLLARARDKRRLAPTFRPPVPNPEHTYVPIGAFWLEAGPLPLDAVEQYVLTPSVDAKLTALARTLVMRKSPVLIQGPTSAGKTSAIEYLARRTGHRFVRINNHEHTDVQEYLGAYSSDAAGRIVYTEGLLVTALRRGDWIVLDELNLAPTDVLEALNRLLDDNRELLIPETGEIVRPHPHFMLFATQNPPGAYAGRKMLSRALRNRFIELHFEDVPETELATILTHRCQIAPSYAGKIVSVFCELQRRRQVERVFDNKHAATLRDLFRWGARHAVGYQQLAETGYMLLAERARSVSDREMIRSVLEEIMRVQIDPALLYSLEEDTTVVAQIGSSRAIALRSAANDRGIVWTSAMRRLVCLSAVALAYNEPVLLVGETGSGKTSVCDVLAEGFGRNLHSFNCHQNTDSADLLGGQRPIRDRAVRMANARSAAADAGVELLEEAPMDMLYSSLLSLPDTPHRRTALQRIAEAQALFEWCDGPLVEAMKQGDHMLLDEVSLADDSVLERLNSVLEKDRTLVLAEKPGIVDDVAITALPEFQIIATMNPGGDYGKKELSPALRNRFTEIFVPAVDSRADLAAILDAQWPNDTLELRRYTEPILQFVQFIALQLGGTEHTGIGVRDLLSWAHFMRTMYAQQSLSLADAFAQGAAMVVIDGLGTLPSTAAMSSTGLQQLRSRCYAEVARLLAPEEVSLMSQYKVDESPSHLYVGPYALEKVISDLPQKRIAFAFRAPTTAENALRLMRACAVPQRSVLLEGSPGAGKTSLIASLADWTGHKLTRINLSEQTELLDLFGAELPVEGGRAGEFAWRPAAFLKAMQAGDWVLLDEMNLASQTVLEGLNACLDHRGTVYIPEIGRSFKRHHNFRIFAAQNPQHQGGARKGLPKSLLNRFTKVHVAELQAEDVLAICTELYPDVPLETLQRMVAFNDDLQFRTMHHQLGNYGAPWEFNLRDLLRWLTLMQTPLGIPTHNDPTVYFAALYARRFRTPEDRSKVAQLYAEHMDYKQPSKLLEAPSCLVDASHALTGHTWLCRRDAPLSEQASTLTIPPTQLACLEAATNSVRLNWLTILTGAAAAGKSSFVQTLAYLSGVTLSVVRLSSASDTMDLLGSFEQYDPKYALQHQKTLLALTLYAVGERLMTAEDSHDQLLALEQAHDCLDDNRLQDAIGICQSRINAWTTSECKFLEEAQCINKESRPRPGQFTWVDGPLVRAAQQGHWLLLEDANMCSASVLDRLNSLFEPNGTLMLSERGMVDGKIPELQKHPDFRVFMTVDPKNGELSRAMRNRGLELFLEAPALERIAPMARIPTWVRSLPLIRAAIQAHATRRGLAPLLAGSWPSDLPAEYTTPTVRMIPRLVKGELTPIGFLADSLEHSPESTLCLASQILAPAQLQIFMAMLSDTQQACLEKAFKDILPVIDQQKARLIAEHWPQRFLNNVWPIDRRRCLLLDSSKEFGNSLALRVRAALRQAALQSDSDQDESSILARAKRRNSDLGVLLLELPALLTALYELVLKATQATVIDADQLASLHLVFDAAQFVQFAMLQQYADYSLLYTLLRIIRTTLREVPIADQSRANALLRVMQAPQSAVGGAAMHTLFARCLPEMPSLLLGPMNELDTAAHLAFTTRSRRIATELLATLHISDPSWSEDRLKELAALSSQLAKELSLEHMSQANALPFNYVTEALPTVLWMLTVHPNRELDRDARLQTLLSLGTDYDITPSSLMVAQMQLWLPNQSKSQHPLISLRATHALWLSGGVQDLLTATLLRSVAQAVYQDRVSLFAWPTYVKQLQDLSALVGVAMSTVETPRKESVHQMLLSLAMWLTSCLAEAIREVAPELAEATLSIDSAVASQDIKQVIESVEKVCSTLAATLPLSKAMQTWLETLKDSIMISNTSSQALGLAYMRLGTLTMAMYIPDVPLDPVAEGHAHRAFASFRIQQLESDLQIETKWENESTGNAQNRVIDDLKSALQETLAKRVQVSKTHVQRASDPVRVARLHTEIQTFATEVVAPKRLEQLFSAVGRDAEHGVNQIESIQASIRSFTQRLQRQFADMHDLISPIYLSLDGIRIGLGILISRHDLHTTKTEVFTRDAAQFPSIAAAQTMPQHAANSVNHLIAILSGLVYSAKTTNKINQARVQYVYSSLYHVWAEQRKRDEEKQAASSQLYTYRGEESSDEEAARLAEQRALFPVYDDVLADERISHRSDTKQTQVSIDDTQMSKLYELHLALYPSSSAPKADMHNPDVDRIFMQERNDVVIKSVQGAHRSLSSELDTVSAAMQIDCLAQRIAKPTKRANFYHDADPSSMEALTPILERLEDRVRKLLDLFPEQAQLQQLQERCIRVAQLGMDSTIARVLAAVEQLLTYVDDWESYASKDTSLQDSVKELTALVVAWRQLELHGWRYLLDDEVRKEQAQVAKLFFYLYESLMQSDTLSEHSDRLNLVSLLGTYIRTSPIGQFSARLHLLESMARWAGDGPSELPSLLHNVAQYFLQFRSKINERISQARHTLEREVQDFVKLATWKDVNVYALKQSAQKTHTYLHRTLRKFRSVLQEPVDTYVAQAVATRPTLAVRPLLGPGEEVWTTLPEMFNAQNGSDVGIEHTSLLNTRSGILRQLRSVCTTEVFPRLHPSHIATQLHDFGTEILETADELAAKTPAFSNEANLKQIKSLATQKRRAWSDLLKELRLMGLSPFLSVERTEENRDLVKMYSARRLPHDSSLGTEAIEVYNASLLAQLERARASVQSPEGDVSPGDLQRALGSIEHGAYVATRLRHRIALAAENSKLVSALHARIQQLCQAAKIITLNGTQHFVVHCTALRIACNVLTEVYQRIPLYLGTSVFPQSNTSFDILTSLARQAQDLAARISDVVDLLHFTQYFACTDEEMELLEQSQTLVMQCIATLESLGERDPQLLIIIRPAKQYLCQLSIPRSDDSIRELHEHSNSAKEVCNVVLVVAQDLAKADKPPLEIQHGGLLVEFKRAVSMERHLRPAPMVQRIREIPATAVNLKEIEPYIAAYSRMTFAHAHNLSMLYRSLVRLDLVLITILVTLASKGFCTPPEEDTQSNDVDAEDGEQLEGGTGLGDGTGAKDISDTLQDDEQMEELQNDAEQSNEDRDQNNPAGEDHARETEQLEGDAHSLDGDQDQEQEGEDQDEEGDDQSIDEEVGDVDPLDPDAVDEKLWGNEEQQETQGKSETQGGAEDDHEHATDKQDLQDENQTKQEEQLDSSNEKDQDGSDNDDQQEEETELEDMPEKQQGLGRELDDEANQQDQQLDDLDLGDEEHNEESSTADDDDMSDLSEDSGKPDDSETQKDQRGDDIETDNPETSPIDGQQDGQHDEEPIDDQEKSLEEAQSSGEARAEDNDKSLDSDDEVDEEHDQTEETVDEKDDMQVDETHDKQPPNQDRNAEMSATEYATENGDGNSPPENHQQPESSLEAPKQPQDLRQAPTKRPLQQSTLTDAMDMNADMDGDGENAGGAAGMQERAVGGQGDLGQSVEGSAGASESQGTESKDHQDGTSNEEHTNPVQSLGDSLQKFRQDVDAIREANQAAQSFQENMAETGEVEHVANDQDADTQALGYANEQQAEAMNQLSLEESESQAQVAAEDAMEEAPAPELAQSRNEDSLLDLASASQQPSDSLGVSENGALSRADVEAGIEAPMEQEPNDVLAEPEREEVDQQAEVALAEFRASDHDAGKAAELWRTYSTLTMDLAFALCEQLRLILAPSLATRLNGDFRTGKRLNLRKIIPYIASDFAKDKIWLRRTKPSAREYQVLLSIDDSKSMAQGRNIHLAYQTLALVTGALMRLEVGDVAVCRFGDTVEMLHEFGAASFSDTHGGQILSSLRFEQTSTDVHSLLSSTLEVLRTARATRASASGADLWQLQIIISDGVCQDHERLRAQIRRAMAERIMLVFVVVDASEEDEKPSRSSILSMNQVAYHTDAAGKLQLEMKRYIDTFPFDSYVIVRDVQSLPNVLATTLRQWAEKIRDA
ncbi:hypothetical protein MYAM1_000308 [Malassezia yamatoensis]|uniref:Midasin n=1 Tax=Malassezia yamatoensis TaxID=253288 RepID=A0AAJ5YNK5_9BASI|nr:hypothetical protein MYAM1_000308 [Malassezia yamatoensis]